MVVPRQHGEPGGVHVVAAHGLVPGRGRARRVGAARGAAAAARAAAARLQPVDRAPSHVRVHPPREGTVSTGCCSAVLRVRCGPSSMLLLVTGTKCELNISYLHHFYRVNVNAFTIFTVICSYFSVAKTVAHFAVGLVMGLIGDKILNSLLYFKCCLFR